MNLTEQGACGIIGSTEEKKDVTPLIDITRTKTSGIYKIVNKVNGKYYVGRSKNIQRRFRGHVGLLNRNIHHNNYLQYSWNKHSNNDFEFLIVEEIPKESLMESEQKYLDIAKGEQDKCYNLSFISDTVEITDETRLKISVSSKGNTYRRGCIIPNYTRELISKSLKIYHKKIGPSGNPAYNNTKYHFVNKNTKECFVGTPYEMSMKHSLNRTCVLRLKRGFLKQHKGWIIV
jgi:group I intron endonuclease